LLTSMRKTWSSVDWASRRWAMYASIAEPLYVGSAQLCVGEDELHLLLCFLYRLHGKKKGVAMVAGPPCNGGGKLLKKNVGRLGSSFMRHPHDRTIAVQVAPAKHVA
jgi:hypothetical protein